MLLAVFIFFQTAHADSNQYVVNSGDILDISVWNEEALQKEVRVLPDGSISFPLAGSILSRR